MLAWLKRLFLFITRKQDPEPLLGLVDEYTEYSDQQENSEHESSEYSDN